MTIPMETEKPTNEPLSALAPVQSVVFMRNCAIAKDDDTCVDGKVDLHFHFGGFGYVFA